MQYMVQFKIYQDKGQNTYLKEHSQWYRELNRSPDNYQAFLAEYKKDQRAKQMNKLNEAVSTLDTVNSIFKIIN